MASGQGLPTAINPPFTAYALPIGCYYIYSLAATPSPDCYWLLLGPCETASMPCVPLVYLFSAALPALAYYFGPAAVLLWSTLGYFGLLFGSSYCYGLSLVWAFTLSPRVPHRGLFLSPDSYSWPTSTTASHVFLWPIVLRPCILSTTSTTLTLL